MLRNNYAIAIALACTFVAVSAAVAEEPTVPVRAARRPVAESRPASTLRPGLLRAGPEAAARTMRVQARRGRRPAGPSIGAVGLGGVAGLSEFEIGPSLRYWVTARFGLQGHLGFGGDKDFIGEDVEYLRVEPTFIVAIGDFGNDEVNVRPYAGGGIRVFRTDIGNRFDDTSVRPAGVGGVEFGFRGVPRLKASGELSVSGGNDLDDFNFGNGPSIGGVRVSGLVHYFFE